MIKTYFVDVLPDGRINGQFHVEHEEDADPDVPVGVGELREIDSPIDWSMQPTPTSAMVWPADAELPVWVELGQLADIVARAIEQIDGAADAVRMEVLSKQTNTEEYKRAEQQAREYRAAGYPADDVPSCVGSWAKAKRRDGWIAQQAADDIIATADRWYGLLDGIRDLRLCAKEDVRHAADSGEVAARVQQFSTDLTNLMKGAS